ETQEIDLDFALNKEGGSLHFETSAQYPFRGVVKDGRIAAVSGNNGADSKVSTVSVTLDIEIGQTLCFDYKVSSEEGYDKFLFCVDQTPFLTVSGEHDWDSFVYTAQISGTHTFSWQYDKDYSVSSGADCAWVDNVSWSGAPAGLLGDANGDGSVDSLDALLILRYSMGLIDDIILVNSDVNGDGEVNSADALIVMRMAMGV
ncbi:MAG: hypothetical protein J6P98_06015, partial [Clostridia bacterium]|nr:hypothetical protein [Clostridia bacterium]